MNPISRAVTWLSFAAAGAGAMYFLDPAAGRRRRARAQELAGHDAHVLARGIDVATRDLEHRMRRVLPSARGGARARETNDDVITARVRSRLGHVAGHPHAIEVSCHDGRVELEGSILEKEAHSVLAMARSTLGVREVVDGLERHASAADVPALQGVPRRERVTREHWSPAARLVVGSGGVAAIALGLLQRGAAGLGAAILGGVAVARSLTNVPVAQLGGFRGRRPAIDITKTVTVHAPVQDVLDLFTMPENFPRFMRHVKEVQRLGENRWRWTVVGPGGMPFRWEGFLDRLVPNELVTWRSAEGAAVANEGSVVFETVAPGVTRLTIRLRYWPPAGLLGHEVARLLGDDPKRELDEDMMRLKSLVEVGKTTGLDGPTKWDDVRS